ncbi:hypothetical protein Droror1_Dr00023419 [Drosera rotundifolia]
MVVYDCCCFLFLFLGIEGFDVVWCRISAKNVGKNLQYNPFNMVFIPSNKPVQQSLIQTVGVTNMGVYIEASSGFGQSRDSIQRHHGILSAELSTIPPNQRTKAAIQAFKDNKLDLPYEVFMGGFILEKLALPKSKGELSLINTNADDNPSVTFNYFSHPLDLKRCVEGIRVVEKIVKSKPFINYTHLDKALLDRLLNMSVQANANLKPRHTNDTSSLEQFCKDTVITIWHYHGGCNVGKVVTIDYRVLGIEGACVIDGSTFSDSPGRLVWAVSQLVCEKLKVRYRVTAWDEWLLNWVKKVSTGKTGVKETRDALEEQL